MNLIRGHAYAEESGILTVYIEPFLTEASDFDPKTSVPLKKQLADYVRRHAKGLKVRSIAIVAGVSLLGTLTPQELYQWSKDGRFSMTYVYSGSVSTQLQNIDLARNSLDEVSPNFFNINQDGTLSLNIPDSGYIASLKARGLSVVPFISNHWNRGLGQTAVYNRHALTDEIVQAVLTHDLDGVNVDLENLTHTDRDAHTDFVRQLRNKLPKDKTVCVSVAANPYGYTQGWHGSYDYRALGELADYLMIMAYDESFEGGEAGPVAGIDFVEKSITYALRFVPKEKLVLGIPFYGRYWRQGDSVGGQALTLKQIRRLLSEVAHTTHYDEKEHSVKATFALTEAKTIGNKTLKAGRYTLWYENDRSIKEKLALVAKHDLRGAGSWSLGQEEASVWDYYNRWLNGTYFADISGSFAADQILDVVRNNWMIGIADGIFEPESSLTRGQLAAVLTRFLGLPDAVGTKFSDVSEGHWAHGYIASVSEAGAMVGTTPDRFEPDRAVTRGELSQALFRVLKPEPQKGSSFSDVPVTHPYATAIEALHRMGVLSGVGGGRFEPNRPVTRAEVCALLLRIDGEGES